MKINKYSNMVSSVNQSKQLKKEGATESAPKTQRVRHLNKD